MKTSEMKKVLKQHPEHLTTIKIGKDMLIGGDAPVSLIAGPCSIENEAQLDAVAKKLKALGIPAIRGGAFKPRTSPYAFQGLGLEGLKMIHAVAQHYGLATVVEVMSREHVEMALPYVDCMQVGSRNMQNFELLKDLGQIQTPILLKRGLMSTVEEFLMSAEYILAGGNPNVIMCERGIRSFDSDATRNVLDVGAVAVLKDMTHLPVVVDPSHAAGKRHLVTPEALSGVAVGADALTVEAHPIPDQSVSDAAQALSFEMLEDLVNRVRPVSEAVGRSFLHTQRKPAHQLLSFPVEKTKETHLEPVYPCFRVNSRRRAK